MGFRVERVNSEITKAISNIINNKLNDPRITEMVSITKVDVSKDLKNAKVFLSVYGNKDRCRSTFEAIVHCSGFIRRELSHELKGYRTMPDLNFVWDDTMAYGHNIETLLDGLKKNDNH